MITEFFDIMHHPILYLENNVSRMNSEMKVESSLWNFVF
jgi:hypothetical protein